MEDSADTKFVTVVIGETAEANTLREQLRATDTHSIGNASNIRGVRREIMEREGVVVLCVTLDRKTLARHGASLRALIADAAGSRRVRTVGIVPAAEFTAAVRAGAACDVYVNTSSDVPSVARCLAEHRPSGEDFSSWMEPRTSRRPVGVSDRWGGRFGRSAGHVSRFGG